MRGQAVIPTRRRQAGFTLIELLIVVAVIGIIAAVAIPGLQRAMLKSKLNRLSADAITLHKAFLQFHIDDGSFPSTSSPASKAFNTRTLEPLVSRGYHRNPGAFVRQLDGGKVTIYDSPNIGGADTEYYAVLTFAAYPAIQIVIGHTENFPGFVGTPLDGGYFIDGSVLRTLDDNILQRFGK